MAETIAQAIKRDPNFLKKEVQKAVKEKEKKRSSRSSSSRLYATATPVSGGSKSYLVDGKLVSEKPKTPTKSSGSGSGSFVGGNIEINATDLKTGISTQKVIDTRTGRTLSNRTISSPAMTFQSSGLGFLSKSLTPQQQQSVLNRLNEETIRKLNTITMSRQLNPFQKNELKKKVLGIGQRSNLDIKVEQGRELKRITNIDYKKLGDQEIKLVNKFNTRQSVTPQQKNEYLAIVRAQGNKLEKQQAQLFKNIVGSPVNYGKNLVLRYERGENNPLFNDLKSFSKGFVKGTVEIVIFPVKTVAGAYKYGTNLVKQAEKQGTRTINILARDVRKIAKGVKNTAKFVKSNPVESGLIVATAVSLGATALGKEFSKNPANALGQAVGFLAGPQLIGKGLKGLSKLSPKFVKIKDGQFRIKGKIKPITNIKDFLSGKTPKFNLFTRNPDIILKSQTVKSGAKSLSEQAKLAGKEITAVNASANQLTSWLGRKKIIRKPFNLTNLKEKFPKGEKSFPITIQKILNKFDTGKKLTNKEFANVNKWLQKNVAPNITLLERSLYADPASGLRISRLGIQKEPRIASIRDLFRGEFKLTSNKPQVLIFENAKVAKFPKQLKDIEKKLKSGIKLTEKETNRLIRWQVQTGSGKFKPIGSTIYAGGKELEVTLAPGEMIKRIKRVGFTFIEGKKVNFVTAEVFKPSKQLANQIKKGNLGKLTEKELLQLEKELSKKLGRKIRVETPKSRIRRVSDDVPLLRFNRNGLRVVRSSTRIRKISRNVRDGERIVKTQTTRISRGKLKRNSNVRVTKLKTKDRVIKPDRTIRGGRIIKPDRTIRGGRIIKPDRTIRGGRIIRGDVIIRDPKPIPRFDLSFKKLKPNQIAEFKAVYRERRNPNKNFNAKSNPIIVKSLKIQSTKNRMLQRVTKLVDNNAARSVDVRVVRFTNKKKKDIGTPKLLKKFTKTKGKALKLVEKPKFTIDTRGEKKQLKTFKRIKPKKKKSVKRKRR